MKDYNHNYDDYTEAAYFTSKKYPDTKERLYVNSLGLIGELAELKEAYVLWMFNYSDELNTQHTCKDNVIKELGDVVWYLANTCHALNVKFSFVTKSRNTHVLECCLCATELIHQIGNSAQLGEIAETFKKHVGHEGLTTPSEKIIGILTKVFEIVLEVCNSIKVPISTVLQTNIEKLKKRYPNGFTISDSINKKDC